ncbi:MAG TPA: discoidin domain-containing protein, partial [Actinomycetota bacterium]|nr:discoidin domain-containing protein [Actinomycetota bacterium]
ARVTGEPPDPGQGDHARPPEVVAPPATAVEPLAEPPPATAVEPSAAAEDRFPAAEAEPGAPADPATGTLAPGAAWHSEWQRLGTPRREPPAGDDSRGGDWDRSASYPPQSGGQEPMPQPGGAGPAGAGRGHGRRVLSAAETAWGTPDFVHRPDPPPAPGELPPREDEAPSFATAWFETGGRTRGTTWPATGAAEPVPFPSEEQLLKRPPLWERLLRRTPIPVPGEGSLRRAPSARDRERQRAIRRFGALVLVVVLVGGGLWLASSRSKPASVAPAGQPSVTSAPPALTSVRPGRVVASTQSGSRLAANVLDGKTSTFWSRLAPSDDNEPFLRFFFDGPVRLARVTIASGASGSEFSRRPRPRKIELRFSDNSTIQTTLADRTGFQTVSFSPRQVSVVRLVILSTYPSAGPQRTSVREVRFFAAKR